MSNQISPQALCIQCPLQEEHTALEVVTDLEISRATGEDFVQVIDKYYKRGSKQKKSRH